MGEGKMPLFKAVVINQKIELTKKCWYMWFSLQYCRGKGAQHDLKTIPYWAVCNNN